jgi:hypothetical protein
LNKKTQYKKTMKVLLLAVTQGGENDWVSERGSIVLADFENRGLTILRLCVSRFGKDIDGEFGRTMLYKRTAIYGSCLFRRKRVR